MRCKISITDRLGSHSERAAQTVPHRCITSAYAGNTRVLSVASPSVIQVRCRLAVALSSCLATLPLLSAILQASWWELAAQGLTKEAWECREVQQHAHTWSAGWRLGMRTASRYQLAVGSQPSSNWLGTGCTIFVALPVALQLPR